MDTLAYDCLLKTVNQALGFLFFSHRQQVVRLMQLHHQITVDDAIKLKSRGGVAIQALSWSWSSSTHFLFERGPLPSGTPPVISLRMRFLLLVTMGEEL